VADRTVSVKLKADISEYTASLARASAETRGMTGDIEKSVDRDLPPVLRRSGDRGGGVLSEGIAAGLVRNSPLIAAAAGGALALGAPLVLAGATALFAGIGAVAAAQSAEVRLAWSNTWNEIQRGAIADSASLIPVFTSMTAQIGQAFERMRPLLRDAFTAVGPQIDVFANSLINATQNALPGLVRAVESGMPVVQGLGNFLESIGRGMSDFFDILAQHAPAAGQAFASLGDIVARLLPTLAELMGQGVELAANVLPLLSGSLSLVLDVVDALGPMMQPLLAGFLAFRTVGAISGVLTTFATGLGSIASNLGGMEGAATRAAGALGTFSALLGPISFAVGGSIAAYTIHNQKIQEFGDTYLAAMNKLRQGGEAMEQARRQIDVLRQAAEHAPAQFLWFGNEHLDALRQAEAEYRNVWNSMTPLAQAQSKIAEWTATVTQRMAEQGPTAEGTRIAQERLAYWTQQAGQAQFDMGNSMAKATGDALAVTPAIALVGDAAGKTKTQVDEAVTSVQAWRGELQTVATSFVDPLNTYKTMLQDKTAAERASAEATAAATSSSTDSWKNYVGNVDVSLTELADRLQQQLAEQENWRANILTITQRGGLEVGQAIAAMGQEGVALAAKMADGSDAEFQRMAALITQDTRNGSASANAEFDTGMRIMAVIGANGGQATAAEVNAKLQIGVDEVARIAAQYGIKLADGINPLLTSLGKANIPLVSSGIRLGGHAEGGYTGDGGKYEPAGIVHRGEYVLTKKQTENLGIDRIEQFANSGYAEGGLVGLGHRFQSMGARVAEHPAFPPLDMHGHGKTSLHYTGHAIDVNTRPGESAQEQRELAPLAALARSLGFRTIFMAPGHYNHLHVDDGGVGGSMGVMTPAIVLPTPPSTAPYQSPISTAADATMQRAYDDATAWVAENTILPEAAGGTADSGNTAGYRALGRTIAASMGYGSQFGAIDSIFTRESGWNPNAQNPTSTAYGIPQFLNATWAAYGGKTSDPGRQIRAGIQYMKDRYGSPNGANAFWNSHHWYDDGGILPRGASLAYNGTGAGEQKAVFTNEQWGALQTLASREVSGGSSSGRPGGSQVVVNIQDARLSGTFEIGGDGLGRIIDGRIVSAVSSVSDGLVSAGVRS
jgi:hypothetical protein